MAINNNYYYSEYPCLLQQVSTFKVNTEDVFKRWSKTMADLKEEIQTLQIQREEVTIFTILD